ncbi:MAG TPA: nitronate monooxygenase family protein [Vicinamibacterales bacterium]|nr:nitronate monooxygenase family protein [Vicinamibacterales bacterium]
MSKPDSPLRTPICDLLHIDHPIIQSGMGRIAGPELVAEVCRAGGLGILAGLGVNGEELRKQIRRARELTDRAFGVNLWLHEQLLTPRQPSDVSDDDVRLVQDTLNQFRRRLNVPTTDQRPAPFPDLIAEAIEVILEERVAVWSVGLGNPNASVVERAHRAGIVVMAMVCTAEDARTVAASGVDVIVAQGLEAGGHRSTWTKSSSPDAAGVSTMTLVPQVVDAVSQPVIAAGGIADGRGLVAAIALGAAGALLGTRFVATKESMAPAMFKDALLAATSEDTTITDAFTGLYARALRNRFIDEYAASGAPVLPSMLQSKAAEDVFMAAVKANDPEYYPMPAGQIAGLIRTLPSAGDVVRTIVAEAEATLRRLSGARAS